MNLTIPRTEFLAALTQLGLKFTTTQANFVLVNIGPAHREFVHSLRSQGILVRDRSADPGCQGRVRITIGTREQMRQAAAAIQQFLASSLTGATK